MFFLGFKYVMYDYYTSKIFLSIPLKMACLNPFCGIQLGQYPRHILNIGGQAPGEYTFEFFASYL